MLECVSRDHKSFREIYLFDELSRRVVITTD